MLDLEQLKLNKYVNNLNKDTKEEICVNNCSDDESEVPFYEEEEEEKKENNEDDKDYYDENDTSDEEQRYWNIIRGSPSCR